jgi:hypothetical protein
VNKGSCKYQDVRARLSARDFKPKGDDDWCDLFAAMPPFEAKEMLFRQAARSRPTWKDGRWQRRKLLLIDVKKAHLNGVVPEDVYAYVLLPDGRCWRLRRWLYGMRPAASAWEADFTTKLEAIGYKKGKSAPTVFHNESSDGRLVVHGDDFTFLLLESDINKVVAKMKGVV